MAGSATACSVEIGLAGFNVSGLQVSHIHTFTLAALRHGFGLLRMDKGGDLGDLFRGKLKRRHSLVDPPMQDNITNLVSAHIRRHQLGPGEITTGFSSTSVA